MSSAKPGNYAPPSTRAKLQKLNKPITEIKSEDFPEFIPTKLTTNKISDKPSYASLLKPKAPVLEEDKPIIVDPLKVRKIKLVDMAESPCKDKDDYLPHTIDFTTYNRVRNERLKREEKRRKERPYDNGSDFEQDAYIPEDDLSEIYDQEDAEDDDDSVDNYDPSEFDRHR